MSLEFALYWLVQIAVIVFWILVITCMCGCIVKCCVLDDVIHVERRVVIGNPPPSRVYIY